MSLTPGLFAAIFAAGVLSFFSPCILPLLPVYFGYFSSENDVEHFSFPLRIAKTAAFTLGISAVFFLMGTGAGFAGSLVNSSIFAIFCGIFIVLMGLYQIGLIRIPALERTKNITSPISPQKGIAGAFCLGFFFSFGWTPCIGPVLSSILGISLEGGSALTGGLLLLVYAAGLAVPFFAIAFTSGALLKKIKKIYPHLGKIRAAGGILVAVMGIWMISDQINSLTPRQSMQSQAETESAEAEMLYRTYDGKSVSFSDWEGKKVYLKFWATWCPVCLSEIDEFSDLASEYENSDEVVIYSVIAPGHYSEMDTADFIEWADSQNLTFPILFDETKELNELYGIRGYPTSVFLDGDQNIITVQIGHADVDKIREILDD